MLGALPAQLRFGEPLESVYPIMDPGAPIDGNGTADPLQRLRRGHARDAGLLSPTRLESWGNTMLCLSMAAQCFEVAILEFAGADFADSRHA